MNRLTAAAHLRRETTVYGENVHQLLALHLADDPGH
jgi:hypothetical protein